MKHLIITKFMPWQDFWMKDPDKISQYDMRLHYSLFPEIIPPGRVQPGSIIVDIPLPVRPEFCKPGICFSNVFHASGSTAVNPDVCLWTAGENRLQVNRRGFMAIHVRPYVISSGIPYKCSGKGITPGNVPGVFPWKSCHHPRPVPCPSPGRQ